MTSLIFFTYSIYVLIFSQQNHNHIKIINKDKQFKLDRCVTPDVGWSYIYKPADESLPSVCCRCKQLLQVFSCCHTEPSGDSPVQTSLSLQITATSFYSNTAAVRMRRAVTCRESVKQRGCKDDRKLSGSTY